MEPITTSLATASIRAGGTITGALMGRYRPSGVPRTGSREDRAEAYRRMLDASTRGWNFAYMLADMRGVRGRAARRYLRKQLQRGDYTAVELINALNGVRLCGSTPVIEAAEDVTRAISEVYNMRGGKHVQHAERVVALHKKLLDACREDLSYNPAWWQWGKRRAHRRYLQNRDGDRA